MKSPFLKVYHKKTGTEISNIESFNYEDSDEKDAYAEFRINGLALNSKGQHLMNDHQLQKIPIYNFSLVLSAVLLRRCIK